ncbi:MAG: PD40 domain-containing protein [Verrucomicrobia bacterium]|nr:PD40 domain-containing protein [Verrucomicrobiota bacterium]
MNNEKKEIIMKTRQNPTRWLGLALACGALTFAVTTQAGKPVKPPPHPSVEPGIVFYAQNGYVKMANSDGSGIQNLFAVLDWREFPRPSDLSHSGCYWFLTVRDDGSGPVLLAIAENGAQVRLSTGPPVQVVNYQPSSNQRWLVSDGKVAFIGSVPDLSTETNLVVGLYLMDINWSSGLPGAAGEPQLLAWTVDMVTAGSWAYNGCDFSADGSTIYFSFNRDLFKAEVATGSAVGPLASNFAGPELSADGSKLVGYWTPNGVRTINVDGSGLTTVFPGSGSTVSGPSDNGFFAFWSPTGQSIVFTRDVWLNKRLNSMSEQVTIVSASGSVLGTVGDKPQFTTTLGWRPAR